MRKEITKKARREFFRQEKIIKRLVILAGLVLALVVNMIGGHLVVGESFGSCFADEVLLKFRQEILPFDPVENAEGLVSQNIKIADLKSSDYRVLTPIKQEKHNVAADDGRVAKNRVIIFSGNALYPNSQIILEVQSKKFYTTVMSDSEGHWEWTNYAHPLEDGEHKIKMYNISPHEISGKKDIFMQGYVFKVEPSEEHEDIESLYLANSNYDGSDEKDLGQQLIGGKAENIYYFDIALLNKSEYNPNDDIDLQLIFSSIDRASSAQAKIKYEIYDEGGILSGVPLSSFEDDLPLDGSGAFLKKINLKNKVIYGDYAIKVTAAVGENEYVQAARFFIHARPVLQIGEVVVTEDKFREIIATNTLVGGLIILSIIILIIFEYRRFWVYSPIDEDVLSKKGYFS